LIVCRDLVTFARREQRIRPRPTSTQQEGKQPSPRLARPALLPGAYLVGWGEGFFITLMQNDGTLDYYRHLAETNPDIAVLIDMIDRLQAQLVIALTAAIRP